MPSRLQIELFLRSVGWPAPVGGLLLCIGLGVHFWWIPLQQQQVTRSVTEYRRLIVQMASAKKVEVPATPAALLATRLAAFEKILPPRTKAPDLVQIVFSEAQKSGLTLSQAEYHLAEDKKGGFGSYQMVLPVQGPYVKVREFIDGVLAEAPSAALEEVAFKRNGIGAAAADARLRLVFYIKGETP